MSDVNTLRNEKKGIYKEEREETQPTKNEHSDSRARDRRDNDGGEDGSNIRREDEGEDEGRAEKSVLSF